VTGVLLGDTRTESPVARRPSKQGIDGAQRNYGDRHDAAASKIGKVMKGGVDRRKAAEKYATEGRDYEAAHDPLDFGLPPYAELNSDMPEVSDDRRYHVRDITSRQVLLQLGARADAIHGNYSFDNDAYNVLQNITSRSITELSLGIQKQMEMTRLFMYQDVSPTASSASSSSNPQASPNNADYGKSLDDPKYLLGKYECVAIPARADFDWAFDPIRVTESPSNTAQGNGPQPMSMPRDSSSSASSKGGGKGMADSSTNHTAPDCDSSSGFAGWFWVLHEGAPNIGESQDAEDFAAYSCQDDQEQENPSSAETNANPASSSLVVPTWKEHPVRHGQFLNEALYLNTMYHLWRLSILAMARLGVTDCILFPFGMGAFLRQLWRNDDRYCDATRMRMLRRKIADGLMNAIASIYGGSVKTRITSSPKDLPQRIHICLMCNGHESAANHNVFIEAAGEIIKAYPGVADILKFRRNADCLQLAHKLASEAGPLKVGILNGANRKLIGNHWFQKGARHAIDENLHRRSASLTRAALLINMGTEPVVRRSGELAANLSWLGGKAESLSGNKPALPSTPVPNTAGAKAAPSPTKASGGDTGGVCGCCKKRAQKPNTQSTATDAAAKKSRKRC